MNTQNKYDAILKIMASLKDLENQLNELLVDTENQLIFESEEPIEEYNGDESDKFAQ